LQGGNGHKSEWICKKMTNYLKQKFPKFMQSLEKKKVWLGIVNDEGRLVIGAFFTTFALIKNYGVNI